MMIPTSDDIKTVTDLRENTISLLNKIQKKDRPTIIVHRNNPKAVLMSISEYNKLIEMADDYMDELIAMELEKEPYDPNNYISEEDTLKGLGVKLS